MANTVQDLSDVEDLWQRDIEEDSTEAANFEFANARADVAGRILAQRRGNLIDKMEADPGHSFRVSSYSVYNSDSWTLEKPLHATERRILFKSDVPGGVQLKKMLTYYLLPQFHPLGTLKSFVSTETYAWAYSLIEKYLLAPNSLDATPDSLKVISARLINEALDRVKTTGSARNYFLLYFILTFWNTLSSNHLIPASHCLHVSFGSVDKADRHNDIKNSVASEHRGWRPFSEDELSRLIEYSLFWCETAMSTMLDIKEFLEKNIVPENTHTSFIKSARWAEFEKILGKQIAGTTICGFIHTQQTTKYTSPDGRLIEYIANHYRWKRNYKQAIDRIRDGILVFVALITGLRKRELGILKFDDVVESQDGNFVINITRFKTSDDPNYFGTIESLPLPRFIGSLISSYRQLRSFDDNMRSGLLFEQVVNSKRTNLVDRSIWRTMSNLGSAVGVVGVHPHRFRKTIAEILISRTERNIDLIRMLFGHRSYTMTLRYIARNPYLVRSVVETMETHYTEAFVDIVAAVRRGEYSGEAAERIALAAQGDPEIFKGTLLRMTVFNYISYLLEAGEPVFIKRTGLGIYCVSTQSYNAHNAPPCISGTQTGDDSFLPDASNCKLHCKNTVILESARLTLERNIDFYSNLLEQSAANLKTAAKAELISQIRINEKHLIKLNENREAHARSVAGAHGES